MKKLTGSQDQIEQAGKIRHDAIERFNNADLGPGMEKLKTRVDRFKTNGINRYKSLENQISAINEFVEILSNIEDASEIINYRFVLDFSERKIPMLNENYKIFSLISEGAAFLKYGCKSCDCEPVK